MKVKAISSDAESAIDEAVEAVNSAVCTAIDDAINLAVEEKN